MLDLHQLMFLIIGCCATLALFILFFYSKKVFQSDQVYFKRPIISAFERRMFTRLKQSFPEYHVLTQVAFSALITNDDLKIRAKFNRKVTDFVILNQKMNVIAIIELDDPTHFGKEQQDAERDAMLLEAGYNVYRYTEIPSPQTLRYDIIKRP